MGSEKHENESAYSDHIAAHGGWCNAYTEFEWTNYHFQVAYNGLQLSLDMLGSNMEAPLLKKSGMEREINAVESEFQMSSVDDNVRTIQILMNECSSKDHLFRLFAWGNMKSLAGEEDYDKLWDDLKKFYNEQYSSDRMKLVVQVKTKD